MNINRCYICGKFISMNDKDISSTYIPNTEHTKEETLFYHNICLKKRSLSIGNKYYIVLYPWIANAPYCISGKIRSIYYDGREYIVNGKHPLALCGKRVKEAKELLIKAINDIIDDDQ